MSKTLKILSRPQGNAEEYGRWSVNPYIGCCHGCLYCYLKKGPSGAYLGQDKPVLKKGVVNEEHAFHLAMAEIIENRDEIIRDGGLFMTFTSDPYLPETRGLTSRIVRECIQKYKVPVTLLTKRADFLPIAENRLRFEDIERCKDWSLSVGLFAKEWETLNKFLATGFTLTGHDELEPNASPNADRIKAMRFLNELKLNVWASIEPIIDFPSSLDMICQALDAGCRHFKIGLLTNNTRVVRKDFQIGEHKFKAYDVRDLLHFIEDVMRMTDGKATVYWKQSVRDLLGEELEWHIDIDPHSVGKDWSMFDNK